MLYSTRGKDFFFIFLHSWSKLNFKPLLLSDATVRPTGEGEFVRIGVPVRTSVKMEEFAWLWIRLLAMGIHANARLVGPDPIAPIVS